MIRSMDKPTETATPMERPIPMVRAGIAPSVISSTCSFRTKTAGSAATTKYPAIVPTRTKTQSGAYSTNKDPN